MYGLFVWLLVHTQLTEFRSVSSSQLYARVQLYVAVTQSLICVQSSAAEMALGGCYTCLKYLMFVFNLIFWVRDVLEHCSMGMEEVVICTFVKC